MSPARIPLPAAALAAVLAATPGAAGFCRTTTMPMQPDPLVCPAQGRPIAWVGGCTSYRIDPRVLPARISLETFRQIVEASAATWASAVCNPATGARPSFRLVAAEDSTLPIGYEPGGVNANTVRFTTRWGPDSFHPRDAAAVTIVTFGAVSASILDTDTELNLRAPDNPFGVTFSTSGASDAADLQTIVTHEFGHVHGLAHASERSAVMWYTAGRGEQRRQLQPDDVAGVCAIYPSERRVACVPELRTELLQGGGLTCATTPDRARAPALAWAVVMVAMALGRRRLTAPRRG